MPIVPNGQYTLYRGRNILQRALLDAIDKKQVSHAVLDVFRDNYGRYKAGEELLYSISFERGY